ncbi:MAG: hypothetical protein JRG92_18295 [Deltaproteobacteria bacterium]|nr:hypothetical protein [Deltaproteobacteria bacterium]MBW2385586.1 hypothetical protein [Deltaproteobacteria bacterium]
MRRPISALIVTSALLLSSCGGDETIVAPSDSVADGNAMTAHAGNQPPEIVDVLIRPAAPRRGDTLTAEVRARDADGDPLTLEYEWRIDGRRMEETGPNLAPGSLGQGQEVAVTVTAHDGSVQSMPVEAAIRLGNQPPMMLAVELHPMTGASGDADLTARAQASDPEGDPIEFSYTWWINGSLRGDDSEVLHSHEFKRGDQVRVAAVAHDGMHESDSLRSDPIEIENAPPHIVSTPTGFGADGIFRYRIQIEDADGDSRFAYRLIEGPQGMVIDSLDGQMLWRPRESQAGTHLVQLEVDDRHGGQATQAFQLELSFEETAVPAAGSW